MTLVWRRTQTDADWLAPTSVSDAVEALSDPGGRVVAGATWVMRGPLRDRSPPERWISLHRLGELRGIREDGRVIGAMTTHSEIARGLEAMEPWRALADAARNSANHAVRNRATLGGNISTVNFPAADLPPALLALDATVEVVTGDGPRALPMGEFVADPPKGIVISVDLGAPPLQSSHQRLTLSAAGDYPVAIVSVVVPDGGMPPRIAIGSVENRPRRWTELEAALVADTNPTTTREAATGLAADLHLRNSPGVDGWYRSQVLPELVHRAFTQIGES